MKLSHFGIGVATVLIFGACSNSTSEERLSPSVVKNPATASAEGNTHQLAVMRFLNPKQDFGDIVQGQSVKMAYEFVNDGPVDLIIGSANGSCGCTVPKWPRKPIKPGEKGTIEVVFNSNGKKNKQVKKVYVTANTNPTQNIIVLTGNVVAPE